MENKDKIEDVLEQQSEDIIAGEELTENSQDNVEETQEEKHDRGRYEELMRLEPNLWTYGSPVVFEEVVLERDLISQKNRMTLKFINVYEDIIRDLHLVIFVDDEDGNEDIIEHSYMALGQKYLVSKGSAAKIPIKNEDARKFRIKVEQVVFQDGSVWQKEDAIYESAGEIDDIETFAEAKLKDYEDSYKAGTQETEQDDSVSIGNGIEILKRISWYKDTENIIKNAKRKYAIVKQNEERKEESQKRREERKKAVKKRYMAAGITFIAVLILAAVSVVAFFIPNDKYKDAKNKLKSKDYMKAAESFEALNGFMNSEEYLAQAYYNIGLDYYNKEEEKKAQEYFKKSRESDAQCDDGKKAGAYVDYYAGMEALNNKQYADAVKLFRSCMDASVYALVNKASAGMAQASYLQGDYEVAWNTIKNVYAKDTSCQQQYGEYGYQYAKTLVDKGELKTGIEIYNQVAGFNKNSANLCEGIYKQAVSLAEKGDIAGAKKILEQIKEAYKPAEKLHKDMGKFHEKVQYWVGTWTHKGKVNGEKKIYTIKISEVLYKGEMCLRIVDKNNKKLGFDTIISRKNRVTQITVGTYQLHFKLKKYSDQKFTFSLLEGNKMLRELKYNGEKYKTKYKKKK